MRRAFIRYKRTKLNNMKFPHPTIPKYNCLFILSINRGCTDEIIEDLSTISQSIHMKALMKREKPKSDPKQGLQGLWKSKICKNENIDT